MQFKKAISSLFSFSATPMSTHTSISATMPTNIPTRISSTMPTNIPTRISSTHKCPRISPQESAVSCPQMSPQESPQLSYECSLPICIMCYWLACNFYLILYIIRSVSLSVHPMYMYELSALSLYASSHVLLPTWLQGRIVFTFQIPICQ